MTGGGAGTGQTIGTIVGAIVGTAIPPYGAFTGLGATIGGMVGGVAGGLYDTVNPPEVVNEQDNIADITFQTSSYGIAIPQVIGPYRLAGNVIDIGPKIEHEQREVQESEGSGGGPRQVTITKTYSASLDIALCDTRVFGVMEGIARAWVDNTILYDHTQGTALPEGWTFYPGDVDPDLDPTFEAIHGVGNQPGYPYLCRVVMADYDLGANARVPNFTFELYQAGAQGAPLTQILISPDDGDVWVAVPTLNQVWRFDETTRDRLAVVQLGDEDPAAVAYGFSLHWADGYLWVGDPVGYKKWRIDPADNTAGLSVNSNNSLIGNQVSSGGYNWIGTLQYDNDPEAALVAYNEFGIAPFTFSQDFRAFRHWLRVAVGVDGNLWTFSDEDDGGQSQAIRIDHTDGNQVADLNIGVDKVIKDVLVSDDGDVWYCNYTDNTLQRVLAASNTVGTAVAVGSRPVQAGLANDGYIWVAGEGRVVTRVNPVDNSTESFQSDTPNVISPNNSIWAQGPSGAMWLVCTADWTVQRFTTTGTTVTVRVGASPRSIAPGADDTVWVVCESGDLVQIQDDGTLLTPVSPSASGLQDAVSVLNQAAGLEPEDFDVSGLPNTQVIMAVVNIAAVRAPLEQLADAHNFIMIESNQQLVYKQRGREEIVVEIPEDDLGSMEQSSYPGLRIQKAQEAELPTTLAVNYVSPTRNYQTNTQMAYVSNSRAPADNNRVMSVQIGLSDLEAKQRAQEMLDRLWVERNTYSLRVGRKYAYLQPADRIAVIGRGIRHVLTIEETTYGRPGILEIQGKSDSAATQYVLGAKPAVIKPGGGVIGRLQHTIARLLNLPALSSEDQSARYHVAYEYPLSSGWPGATLHRSVDDGTSYSLIHTGNVQGITGTVATPLADADWHFLDEENSFTVVLTHGSLASITDTLLFNSTKNVAMLGNELVQFAIATLVGDNTYECSRILRGRQGTEWAVGLHGSNEQFCLLDAGVYQIDHPLTERNYDLEFKAVTNGLSLADATEQEFTPTDENLTLWVLFPDIEQDGTDWIISWYGRARWGGDFVDAVDVGPDPDFTHYRLEIYEDNTYETVLRTIDQEQSSDFQVKQTYTYTEAQQIEDFGSAQDFVYFRLFQVGTYGNGRAQDLVAAS